MAQLVSTKLASFLLTFFVYDMQITPSFSQSPFCLPYQSNSFLAFWNLCSPNCNSKSPIKKAFVLFRFHLALWINTCWIVQTAILASENATIAVSPPPPISSPCLWMEMERVYFFSQHSEFPQLPPLTNAPCLGWEILIAHKTGNPAGPAPARGCGCGGSCGGQDCSGSSLSGRGPARLLWPPGSRPTACCGEIPPGFPAEAGNRAWPGATMEGPVSRAGRARGGRGRARGPGVAAGRGRGAAARRGPVRRRGSCRRRSRRAWPGGGAEFAFGREVYRPFPAARVPAPAFWKKDAARLGLRHASRSEHGAGRRAAAGGCSGQAGGPAFWPRLEGSKAPSIVRCPQKGMAGAVMAPPSWHPKLGWGCGSSLPPRIHRPPSPSSGPFALGAVKDQMNQG